MFARYFIPVLVISLQYVKAEYSLDDLSTALANIPEDGRLEFCELMNKYNYPCERHEVITKDGYILRIFRIPRYTEEAVFLQHGFIDSSDTWGIRRHESLAAWLYNNTYDVWLGNIRGNMHSRAHVTLDPDHSDFWDFSFHEMAIYDVPAMIDFILEQTGQTKLQVIAHSQGTQLFYVLGALNPGYSAKIKHVICYAPIAYLKHAEQQLFPLVSLAGGPLLSAALGYIGRGEILRDSSAFMGLMRKACALGLVGYTACGLGVASVMFGPDPAQLEPEFLPIAFAHYPCGSSMKNAVHLAQIIASDRFAQYDYGLENFRRYGSLQPPVYDLSKVPFNVSLYVGKNDRLSAIEDVDRLRAELNPEVVQEYYVIPYEKWNHIDFVWGKSPYVDDYLFVHVKKILQNNNY